MVPCHNWYVALVSPWIVLPRVAKVDFFCALKKTTMCLIGLQTYFANHRVQSNDS